MKITTLFLFVFVLCSMAENAVSQNAKVNINKKNVRLEEVLNEIEAQTNYLFIYNSKVNTNNTVSVKARNKAVSEVLSEIFQNSSIDYSVEGRHIVLNTINKQTDPVESKNSSIEQQGKTKTITGTVANLQGEELPGVSIKLKGTNMGTTTDINGRFTLTVPYSSENTLIFNYIGHVPKEVKVEDKDELVVELSEDMLLMDEVVVVGYAMQKKANLSGSVSTIKMDDIKGNRTVPTTGNLLQGTMPGLQVTSGTGEPGGGFSFNVRGMTGLDSSNNQGSTGGPLILVDNVPFTAPLNLLNPNDIESVTVLKDAASASIYGARSTFGVVLITTKKGSKAEKLTINYSNNFTFTKPVELPVKANPLQTVQAYDDAGYITYYTGQNVKTWLGLLQDYNLNPSAYPTGYTMNGGMRYQLAESDLIGGFLNETGFQQQHNASISGGTERTSYRISFGYTDEDGIMVTDKDSYRRYNGKGFIGTDVTKWLTAQMDMSFSQSNKSISSGGGYSEAVSFPSYTPTDTININGETLNFGTPVNLVRMGAVNTSRIVNTRITGRLIATPVKDLTITGEYTHDNINQDDNKYSKRVRYANPAKFTPEYTSQYSTYSKIPSYTDYNSLNVFGSYNKSINKKHNFTGLLGYNQESYYKEGLENSISEMINDNLPSIIQASGTLKGSDNYDEYSLMGFFGRINYDFEGKYLLEVNGRYDGSSKFPPGHRWGFFPSVSVAWRLSEENFMSFIKPFVSNFKIRGSFGSVGNQNINSYAFVPGMEAYRSSWLNENIKPVSLKAPGLVSSNFTWETVETNNIGFDISLLNNRFSAVVDLYRRYTKDMLSAGVEYPATLGTSAPLQNVADLKSQGFEVELSWKDKIGNVNYYLGANLYNYDSYITKFNNEAGLISTYYVGQKLGNIWGYVTDRLYTTDDFEQNGNLKPGIPKVQGITPKPGDVLYKKFDETTSEITPGQSTIYNPGDRKVIGNNGLHYQYGFRGGFSWKDISFSFIGQGIGQRDIWVKNELTFPYFYEFGTIYADQLDYWTPDNPNAFFPRLYPTGNTNKNYEANTMAQTRYLSDGSYLRIKNISLSYSIPGKIINPWGLTSLQVFFSAENPYTYHHMPKGVDPSTTAVSRGLGYPFVKSYSFGINLSL